MIALKWNKYSKGIIPLNAWKCIVTKYPAKSRSIAGKMVNCINKIEVKIYCYYNTKQASLKYLVIHCLQLGLIHYPRTRKIYMTLLLQKYKTLE